MICFFACNGFATDPCRGRIDPCHLIPKQRIKRAFPELRARELEEVVWDARIVVPGCRKHHHAFDVARTIRLDLPDYPPSVHKWAEEYGFEFFGPERGWVPIERSVSDDNR